MPRDERYFAEEEVLRTLRNTDMSDPELLDALKKAADRNGVIDPADVAEQLRIHGTDHRTPAGTVSGRMAYMDKLGLLAKVPNSQLGLPKSARARYLITTEGERLRKTSKLSRNVLRELDKGGVGAEVALAIEVARRGATNGAGVSHKRLVRRGFNSAFG